MHGGPGHQYGVAPHEHNYDQVHDPLGDDMRREGETEMKNLAKVHIVDQKVLHQLEADVYNQVYADTQNVQAAQNAHMVVTAFEDANPAVAANSINPGPLAGDVKAISRARAIVIGCVSGMLGLAAGATGAVFTTLKLSGYYDAAKKIADLEKAAEDAKKNGTPPPTDKPTPTMEELTAWDKIPDDTFFAVLKTNASRKGAEWSLATWLYVVDFLGKIEDAERARATNKAYQGLIVADSVIDADYTEFNDNQASDPFWLLDKSGKLLDPATVDARLITLYSRGVRLDYVKRVLAKGMEIAKANGTV